MFKNSDSDIDTKVGHTHNGKIFREAPLINLFERSHEPLEQDEGFYSGEEEELLNEEHLESAREEEGKNEEPLREESETSGTALTVEVCTITPFVLVASSNQSSQSHQINQKTVTSSSTHTQSSTLGISMEYEMRLPIFRGDGSKDPDQH
jgi:hypothetical protein